MTAAAWTALALWILVAITLIVSIFLIRLLLRLARVSAHIDISLAQMDKSLPQLMDQSTRTMESVELAMGQARVLMAKIGIPLESIVAPQKKSMSILSPQLIAGIVGFIKVLRMFRGLFAGKN